MTGHNTRTSLVALRSVAADTHNEFALRFQGLEPCVIPKRSLTGDTIEGVDTRVVQVLYEIVTPDGPAA